MMVGSVWLRGVINADANGGVMRVILPLAWSLLPVLLVLSVIGGYFIASRALRPVRQLTAAANAISDVLIKEWILQAYIIKHRNRCVIP